MNTRIRKWIIRPLVVIAIVLAALAGVVLILLETEQQRLADLAVRELNLQLKGELTIGKSSISPFKHFPYLSVALHDVKLFPDKTESGAPILDIKKLYVGFSITDLFHHDYNVRKLSLHGGHVNLIKELDGNLNILEVEQMSADSAADPSKKSAGFDIDLHHMMLKDITICYLDRANGRELRSQVADLTASFIMNETKMAVELDSKMEVDYLSQGDTSFFRHKKIQVDLKTDYKRQSGLLEITSCKVGLQDASFIVEGSAELASETRLDLRIKGDKPDLNMIAAFFPGDIKTMLKPYQYDGIIYFNAAVIGIVSKEQLPLINVAFGCKDGWFLNTAVGKKVDQLAFTGFFTNGNGHTLNTSEIHITNVSARPGKGVFKGNFVLKDFTFPKTLIQIRSDLELRFLGEFFGIRDLEQITGKIKLDMDFKELKDIVLPEQSLNKLKEGIESKLIVEGLTFKIPGYPYTVQDLNMKAEMENGKITVDSASLRIGNSDLKFSGSVSDVHAFLRERDKIITLALNASGKRIVLSELLAYDTALARKVKEEIKGFNVELMLQTSVAQLLHPAPLPKGKFEMKNLRASFKRYPHAFENIGATATINDTLLRLHDFNGMIDKSDFRFSGRVINYELWFEKIKKGKTQIAFDFKSTRFAITDILGNRSRKLIPEGYRDEEAANVWLRAKVDLRYDTGFRFAKAKIVNITGTLKKHNFSLKDVKGGVKYGTNRIMAIDTLTGSIGRSDFDINLRYFTGLDKHMKKRTNSLTFRSKMLDMDEMARYDLAPVEQPPTAVAKTDSSSKHAKAFNIFMIPFSDFNIQVDVGKLKYDKLWLKDLIARVRMQEDHFIYVDTLGTKVADGAVGMKGFLNGSDPGNIFFNSTIDVEQVDLEKMMIKLDHFGQDVVINKNIKGRLSGQIKSYVQVHPNMVPIVSKTKADLNIRIYNGTLVDFAPMQAMSSYFKDKNLKLIRFDTLHNQFSFTNGVLDIPVMNINSSLGFIQVSGKQSLDLTMEYYVRVPLKMVTKVGFTALFEKKPEEVDINQVDEIDYSDKDKKMRFMNLKVTGKPEDFKVGLGRDKRKN